jgi:glycosyltransferase involved in cell wall biosynthesis
MNNFINKQTERGHYVLLMMSILLAKSIAYLLCLFPFLILNKKKKKDVLFMPYYPKDNAGCIVRFQNYLPFFNKENISYDISYIGNHDNLFKLMVGKMSKKKAYIIYRKILWNRLFYVLKSRNYTAIYIQRCVYPLYPDLKKCFLGELLYKLHNNITIDFYDADYTSNESLVISSANFAHKISVVNMFLESYFKKLAKKIFIHSISLDKTFYKPKISYKIHSDIKIVWCGTKGHFKNLNLLDNVFMKLSKEYKIKIVIISHEEYLIDGVNVKNVNFNLDKFTEDLKSCDIAVYPVKTINERSKGGMAMKALEYSATGLPTVATPSGLSPYFKENEEILIAHNEKEWHEHLSNLIRDENLRIKLGRNIYNKFIEYHSLDSSYNNLKNILFEE